MKLKAMFMMLMVGILSSLVLLSCGEIADPTDMVNGDITPPTVAIISPASDITISNYSYIISGTAADNKGLEGVYLSRQKGAVQKVTGTGAWSISLNNLSEGSNLIEVYAKDISGNQSATASVLIIVQTGAPVVSVSPMGDITTNQTFSILLTVDKDFGYWSTDGSTFVQFAQSSPVVFTVSADITLLYYGSDGLHTSTTQTSVYTITNVNSKEPPDLDYVFDLSSLPEITIEISSNQWNTLLFLYDTNHNYEEYVYADYTFNKTTNEVFANIGIRLRGNTSRKRPEGSSTEYHDPISPDWHHAHFRINFKKYVTGRRFHGLRSINLKWFKDDPLYIREIYCYDLFRRFGVGTAPRSSYVKLNIKIKEDATTAYFGIYEMVEAVDESYLAARFTNNDEGYLWKCLWTSSGPANLKPESESRIGIEDICNSNDVWSVRPSYDLKTHKADFTNLAKPQLVNFINNIDTKSGAAFKTWLEGAMDVDMFLKALAVNVIVGMWDDIWINPNNYYLYFDDAGKCHFVPYDYDNTLGTSAIIANAGTQDVFQWGGAGINPLLDKVMSIPEFKATYSNYLVQLINTNNDYFAFAKSTNRIQQWQDTINPWINNDTLEDTTIVDVPAGWGNCGLYKLMSGQQDWDGFSFANYFKVKARSAESDLGLPITDYDTGGGTTTNMIHIKIVGLTLHANGYYIAFDQYTNFGLIVDSISNGTTNNVTNLSITYPGTTNITNPQITNIIDLSLLDPTTLTEPEMYSITITVKDDAGSEKNRIIKIYEFRDDYLSPEISGGDIIFRWKGNPIGNNVYLRGEFNSWDATEMLKWELTNVSGDLYAFETNSGVISSGQKYKIYYSDGSSYWMPDPANTDNEGAGNHNSIIP